jgi:histidinol-phosphate/aromatic aminotransferase/cobyric acid decarboxylase-like protein
MFLALRELLSSNSRVLLFNPTYGEYAHICTNVIGCHVEFFNLDRESNFVVDLARLSERVCGGAYDLVIIVNPNNPTGQLIERKQLEATIASFPARTKTWIDEAYIDYAGAEHSLARFAATRENVFVCKSLSKVLALSGLRVASLVGNKEQIDRFKLLTPPWSLSLPAQLVLVEALNDLDYYSRCYKQTHELRRKLQDGLRNLGFDVLESTANFLLVEYSNELPEAAALIESCRSRKLLLRDVRSMGSATSSHCFRVAVKQSSTNSKMLSIIATVLEAREKS